MGGCHYIILCWSPFLNLCYVSEVISGISGEACEIECGMEGETHREGEVKKIWRVFSAHFPRKCNH